VTGRVRGVLAGLVAGLAGGLFGVGGGIILVPTLTGVFGLTQHQAHGTSLAVIAATAIPAVIVYGLAGNVAWTTAILAALASLFTARYGARLATRLSSLALKRSFAVFLILVALRLLWKPPAEDGHWISDGGPVVWAFDLGTGALVGLIAGFMGVGGGAVAVPAFTLGLGMSQHAAQGTSLAIILVTGPAGALEHARHGNLVGRAVLPLALGAAIGAPVASWLANHLPHTVLVRCFAVFLILTGTLAWVGAVGPPGPGKGPDPGSTPA
jgi:uncharacterized membrane protein YfcA